MKDDRVYLHHILEAIERIQMYTSAGSAAFRADLKTQDAVVRNLQIIGEASKKLSSETRAASPDVPWHDIVGMRDRIVHDYFGVSLTSCGMSSRTTCLRCEPASRGYS